MTGVTGVMLGAGSTVAGKTATDFDGTDDYGTRTADLVGNADSKQGTVSFWFRKDGGDGAVAFFLVSETSGVARLTVSLLSTNLLRITARNAAGPTIILNLDSVATILAGAAWRHIAASWDLATAGARHLYIDGASSLTVNTFTNDTIDYTNPDWSFCADAPIDEVNGCISEFLFHNTYIDLSVAANLQKFRSTGGRPVKLGANGSIPLGVQPLIYVPTGDPSANLGSGGNFTITGTPSLASTAPAYA